MKTIEALKTMDALKPFLNPKKNKDKISCFGNDLQVP